MTSIVFEQYSAYSYVLRGHLSSSDQEEVERRFEATFNDRLRGGPGWIIRNRHCSDVSNWIETSESLIADDSSKNEVTVRTLLASIASIEGQLHSLKAQLSQLDIPAGNSTSGVSRSKSPSTGSTSVSEGASVKPHSKPTMEQKSNTTPRLLGSR